jgi:hypothetical protein
MRSARRARNLRRFVCLVVVAGAWGLGAPRRSGAAELHLQAADSCVERSGIVEQVDELLGRPLASVPGVSFEVEIARAPRGGWRLRLETAPAGGAREISAASCAELADAAAVAIAMTIQSMDAPAGARPPPPSRLAASAPSPSPPPPPPADAALSRAAPAGNSAPRVHPAVALGLVGEAGALPQPTAGVELEAALAFRRVRLALGGTVLVPRERRLSGDQGGSFDLAAGSMLVCLPYDAGSFTVRGCAGFELGYLWGQGVGVSQPRLGGALWEALRGDIGLVLPLGGDLGLVARAGAVAPLSRPQFALDGTVPVHKPSAVTGRVAVGVELGF